MKTRRALQVKREQGQYIGAVPIYGYKRSEDNRHRLMTDPNTYKVVQSIYQMKLAGFSAAKIAVELNKATVPSPLAYKRAQGIACPTGGYSDKPNARWSATTILRI